MIIPVYTLPLYDIGMMISLRTGCTTNNAEDITPPIRTASAYSPVAAL